MTQKNTLLPNIDCINKIIPNHLQIEPFHSEQTTTTITNRPHNENHAKIKMSKRGGESHIEMSDDKGEKKDRGKDQM